MRRQLAAIVSILRDFVVVVVLQRLRFVTDTVFECFSGNAFARTCGKQKLDQRANVNEPRLQRSRLGWSASGGGDMQFRARLDASNAGAPPHRDTLNPKT